LKGRLQSLHDQPQGRPGIPADFRAACSGTPFEFVDLLVVKPGPAQEVFLAFRFGLVAVKTLAWTSADDGPTETITFEYGSLTVGYKAQSPDGHIEPMMFQGWDRVRNVGV
jgi:type VI protein secretion system component Hcp